MWSTADISSTMDSFQSYLYNQPQIALFVTSLLCMCMYVLRSLLRRSDLNPTTKILYIISVHTQHNPYAVIQLAPPRFNTWTYTMIFI